MPSSFPDTLQAALMEAGVSRRRDLAKLGRRSAHSALSLSPPETLYPKGAEILAASLLSVAPLLTSIELVDQAVRDAGCTSLANALAHNTALTELRLEGNELTCSGAAALAQCLSGRAPVAKSLQSLSLRSNRIKSRGAELLMRSVSAMRLVSLDLCHNSLAGDLWPCIAAMLGGPCSITSLNLSRNRLGVVGMENIIDALQANTALTQWDLSSCGINYHGAQCLLSALENNSSLSHIDLQHNAIGNNTILRLKRALEDTRARPPPSPARPVRESDQDKRQIDSSDNGRDSPLQIQTSKLAMADMIQAVKDEALREEQQEAARAAQIDHGPASPQSPKSREMLAFAAASLASPKFSPQQSPSSHLYQRRRTDRVENPSNVPRTLDNARVPNSVAPCDVPIVSLITHALQQRQILKSNLVSSEAMDASLLDCLQTLHRMDSIASQRDRELEQQRNHLVPHIDALHSALEDLRDETKQVEEVDTVITSLQQHSDDSRSAAVYLQNVEVAARQAMTTEEVGILEVQSVLRDIENLAKDGICGADAAVLNESRRLLGGIDR